MDRGSSLAARHGLGFQFVRYFVSGGSALFLHVATLVLLVEVFGSWPTVASGIGFVVATVWNYTLQRYWVFEADGSHRVLFSRYVAVTFVTFGLNIALFWLLYRIVGLWYPASQVVATGVIFLVNFVVNRSYTFRR